MAVGEVTEVEGVTAVEDTEEADITRGESVSLSLSRFL